MGFFEYFFIDLGLSWTLSKFLPYVILVSVGVMLGRAINHLFMKRSQRWKQLIVLMLAPLCLFIGYFAYSPIYIGDVRNGAEESLDAINVSEFEEQNLVIIAIPGCPYCAESFDLANKIQSRIPSASISFVLSYGDSSDLNYYKELADPRINLSISSNETALLEVSKGNYPSYAILKEGKVKSWSNNSIGVLALDEIEKHLK